MLELPYNGSAIYSKLKRHRRVLQQSIEVSQTQLECISIKEQPKWARRIIDAERKRRKSSGDTAPTKAEKRRMISVGEGEKVDSAPISNSHSPNEAASTTKASKKRGPPARTEVDGQPLHKYVAEVLPYSVSYDNSLYPSHKRSLSVFGTLQCQRLDCRNHWVSGVCATVLEFSRTSMKYRITIHSQQCRNCLDFAEPKFDQKSYAHRIKWVLDLWTGNKETQNGAHERALKRHTRKSYAMLVMLANALGRKGNSDD